MAKKSKETSPLAEQPAKTVEQYKAELLDNFAVMAIPRVLKITLDKIKFLESIYQTGGANNGFSEEFKMAAVKERDALCNQSSACYDILREHGYQARAEGTQQ